MERFLVDELSVFGVPRWSVAPIAMLQCDPSVSNCFKKSLYFSLFVVVRNFLIVYLMLKSTYDETLRLLRPWKQHTSICMYSCTIWAPVSIECQALNILLRKVASHFEINICAGPIQSWNASSLALLWATWCVSC